MPFHTASEEEIKSGKTSDVYFSRTVEILKAKGIDKRAKAEVRLKGFPLDWKWGVIAGIEEVAELFKGIPVDIYSMDEGTIFSTNQPVLIIDGRYIDYSIYETALLGLICQASGIATKAARCKRAAGGKGVISFGARRMHPAVAPMIERNAFIGGCDGVAVIKSAELLEESPVGTIPHALVLMFGDSAKAVKAFHEVIEPNVKRVALVDTFYDEKYESLRAVEALGKELYAVRLDTPSSRRGDMLEILREVRWELDYRGFKDVKIFVSGGLDEAEIERLNEVADAYGVGTSISSASVIDFSFDIVEIDGKPISKRGKESGAKKVLRCMNCFNTIVLPSHVDIERCSCKGDYISLLKPLIIHGEIKRDMPSPQEIRRYVLDQMKKVD
ncbi:MAG: nicotinate phosphoribosyltransferase [Nitrospinae bacterium]|nr:nicotinate phosphoribosyltransferase [Nitrospinota bacterium]